MKKITLIIIILGALIIANAQIEIKELTLTPEMEEKLFTGVKNLPEMQAAKNKNLPKESYPDYDIKNWPQLENLHTGKPIPKYYIVNEKLRKYIFTSDVSRISDGDPLSLRFANIWHVPVMADGVPLLFGDIHPSNSSSDPVFTPGFIGLLPNTNIIEHFHNYELKDSIIGFVGFKNFEMDYFIIRKENQDIFVQIYDEATGEYLKNEYSFSELINYLKEEALRKEEAREEALMRYYAQIENKSKLKITSGMKSAFFSHLQDKSDRDLSYLGIKNRVQLKHLHLGKPIPWYLIVNENLTFSGGWQVPVMFNGKPLFYTSVRLEEDGQYRWTGSAQAAWAEVPPNYEHKNLIIGFLGTNKGSFLIIRRKHKDIFIQIYDRATREYLKNEYNFSELIDLLKKKNDEKNNFVPPIRISNHLKK